VRGEGAEHEERFFGRQRRGLRMTAGGRRGREVRDGGKGRVRDKATAGLTGTRWRWYEFAHERG